MLNADDLVWTDTPRDGDPSQFDALYQEFFPRIYQLAYRFVGHAGEAEEHAQDIFIRFLQKRSTFRGKSSIFTWLYRLAVNHLTNVKRRNLIQEVPEQVTQDLRSTTPQPALQLALEKAIRDLPDGYRNVFVLHDRQGLNHEEIADILAISVGTSKSQLCRARMALRSKLQPYLTEARP